MRIEIIVALIALAGTLFGSLIGFQIARRNIKDQFFYASAAKLKQSFADILRLLHEPPERFEIIEEFTLNSMDICFWDIEKAVIEFTYALPKFQREGFREAWENYRGKEGSHDKLAKKYCNQQDWQQKALSDIEAILAFTEPLVCPFWESLKIKLKKI